MSPSIRANPIVLITVVFNAAARSWERLGAGVAVLLLLQDLWLLLYRRNIVKPAEHSQRILQRLADGVGLARIVLLDAHITTEDLPGRNGFLPRVLAGRRQRLKSAV